MKRLILMALVAMFAFTWSAAQRKTDALNRGVVAVKVQGGVYCSWRICGEEYYDVTYNLYRDGTKIAENLSVSNYTDAAGTASSQYAVSAVVRGKEQAKSSAATVLANNYLEVKMNHGSLTSTYIPNDACCADVDGDGELEILLKFDNQSDANNSYMPNGWNGEYAIVEVYKLDGTKLWWLDFGPNMGDFQNNENNIVAYDWDQDGKAEALMRAADGTVIHAADGQEYVIGDKSKNYRSPSGGGGVNWFMHEGAEYLVYMDGATGKPYVTMDYPLKRLETGETDLEKAWGDGYGHRSSKHFFGAPCLDGRKPSIFLARGIYTRHKMIALDVDPATHLLTERWRWNCSDSSSPWYGNGFHNYAVVDVDWDGRDEIVFGSMVIDDNGKGLSTTGLGHGDAQHHGDFDPYTWGQEIFTCLEEGPVYGNALRDGTTSKIYYKFNASKDDGRAIMGNFSNNYPGAIGTSANDPGVVSAVTRNVISGATKDNMAQNMRIYWDGDLQEETFNYTNGKNTAGGIYKYGRGLIATLSGSLTNNDTKGTPCYQGDLFGDWREEVIMRTGQNNIRIYTTTTPTAWRNYTLWHDMQYRQAMVWQMCGYNQPPHVSYFLGELEGITAAPPALTMTGRTEVANGGTISNAGEQVITCETGDMTVTVSEGAQPYIYIDNAPSWVQGTNSNSTTNPVIKYDYYTHTLTGGAFAGDMRLVKQGDGTLVLPKVTETYSGATEVWAGRLRFDGTMKNSRVWLNRHTSLMSDGGTFEKGIQADYNATIYPGGEAHVGQLTADSLILNFGSCVVFDIDGSTADLLTASVLKIEKKKWPKGGGPAYDAPVFRILGNPAAGTYKIGQFTKVDGSLDDIVVEGLTGKKAQLTLQNGALHLAITDYVAKDVTWTGSASGNWDTDASANFMDADGKESVFVPGSKVVFDDQAQQTTITVVGNVAPSGIVFANETKSLTLKGDSIAGDPTLEKTGAGTVAIQNKNHVGNTTISGGQLTVASLANNNGVDYGSLGNVSKRITIGNDAVLAVSADVTSGQAILIGEGGATLSVGANRSFTQAGAIQGSGQVLTKTGTGTLNTPVSFTARRLVIKQGAVSASQANNTVSLPENVEFQGGTLYSPSTDGMPGYGTNANFNVPEGKTGAFYGSSRGTHTGKLTGAGTFTVYGAGVRCYWDGDWSGFEGTLVPALQKRGSYDPSFDFRNSKGLPKATLKLNNGVTFNSTQNITIGNVTGTGTLGGSVTYTIGALGNDIVASFKSTASVVKTGSGTMLATTAGNISNGITVEEGELRFYGGDTTPFFGSKQTILKGSGSIAGSGLLASLTMESGTQLTPCSRLFDEADAPEPSKLKTTAAANIKKGATLNILVNGTESYSAFEPKYLTMNGTLKITLGSSYTPKLGDSFTVWTSGSFAGTPSYDLPQLPDGLYWDVTGLTDKTGVLRISDDPTGIEGVAADAVMQCEVYTVGGLRVGSVTAKRADISRSIRQLGVQPGLYVVRMTNGHSSSTETVMVK